MGFILLWSATPTFADSVNMPSGYYEYYCYNTPVYCCWNTVQVSVTCMKYVHKWQWKSVHFAIFLNQLNGNWSLIRYHSDVQITCGDLNVNSVGGDGRSLDLSATFRTFSFDPVVTKDITVNTTSLEFSSGRWVSRKRLFGKFYYDEIHLDVCNPVGFGKLLCKLLESN